MLTGENILFINMIFSNLGDFLTAGNNRFVNTIYCKLFEVQKFCGFCGLIGERETFPAKHFRSSYKVECHSRTLQEENRTVNAIYSWLFRIPLPLVRFHV